MSQFETRILGINESEDEFLLALQQLYAAANPETDTKSMNLAMKQKLMPSRLDQDIATENLKKRRARNAEAVATARKKRTEKA